MSGFEITGTRTNTIHTKPAPSPFEFRCLVAHFLQSSLTVGVPVFKTHLPGANDIVQGLGADRNYCFCFLANMLFTSLLDDSHIFKEGW